MEYGKKNIQRMLFKIVAISDTHEKHNKIIVPNGNILIHAGDWTNSGKEKSILNFLEWFASQPHQYKILIPGNHEISLDQNFNHEKSWIESGWNADIALDFVKEKASKFDINFLLNSSIIIEGYKFYGSPAVPFYFGSGFNFYREEIVKVWENIPLDTDILITHGPPYRILDSIEDKPSNYGRDLHQGCKDLVYRLQKLTKLKCHIFGHIHFSGGRRVQLNNVNYINAAICNDLNQPINQPVIIDIN